MSERDDAIVYGVDEAGRGPLLGPMTLAVVALDRAGVAKLTELGVQDSKRFGSDVRARARRRELAEAIEEVAIAHRCAVVSVDEIDRHAFRGQLNHLERQTARGLLAALEVGPAARIICDGARIFAPLTRVYPRLAAVNKGEDAHVAVAAASVLAKHARDEAFAAIAAKYAPEFGPITGGGYLNAATRRFVDAYEARHGALPPEARKSWGAPKQLELPS
ncbi:MAG: hypothetical protein KC636_32030 [Myxococcales bacterium]|nr:hypothetical protein [Myxococcales bacterium]